MNIDKMIKELEQEEADFTVLDKIDIWVHRTFGGFIDFFRYDLKAGLQNFWRYKKVIWRHRWYDYSFADDVVAELYKDRVENWHKNHYVNGDKDEVELKIIVELFKRLEDAEYLVVRDDPEDKIRKEIYQRIARKRYWD